MEFDENDSKKLKEILKRPYFNLEDCMMNDENELIQRDRMKLWRGILEDMLEMNKKAEIEFLSENHGDLLVHYISNKISDRDCI